MQAFRLEDDVDDYVKKELTKLGLMKNKDFNVKSQMSPSLKSALLNASKTKDKTSYGEPDFSLEKYTHPKNKESVIPIIIENKLYAKNLKKLKNDALQNDDHSISKFAVNGALHYAQNILKNKEKYKECIAIGIAGDDEENLLIEVYYVFASGINSHKLTNAKNLHFLENQESFNAFYKECTLTEEEKHFILIKTKADLNETAKKLNRLMHNHNITAPQRVLYVSGMLLGMQEIKGKKEGLKPSDLKGELTDTSRDGVLVFNQISEFLKTKNLSEEKRELMLASFKEISKDPQRDKETSLDKAISMLLEKDSSITKQIFTFLYEFVHKPINESDNTGHLDIMGELYSEFLKYALGDGKELGIVLTPPYVTKMMSELLGVNAKSFVMDLATGSAGFLISSMVLMIEDIEKTYGKNTTKANEKIKDAKTTQLLGVELNAEMFSLATTNMILRGDGSSLIIKGNTFETNLIEVYYVFASGINSHKLTNAKNLHFLENQESFNAFYKECTLTEEEKHFILIKTKADLNETAKKLNRLMHNHNITAPQRVLYVSGMLLGMQEIKGKKEGLKPSDLKGELTDTSRDGVLVFNQISEFLKTKNLSEEKRELMLASFKEISKDPQRDKETSLDKAISMLLEKDSSITKQIFTFLYEFVHKPINESDNTGHLDIMGELYSEFLKYALGDGKELGIVLTPPYVTKMMSELLGVNAKSFVMDLATGSAGFLISSMVLMIEDIEKTYGKNTTKANEKIKDAKTTQLLGVELNAEMFSLATTNMILRGDGSSLIIKGNTFETNKKIYEDFKPNILLLNPPFSYEENGMPFIKFGLEYMQKGALGAIIIQDSAGSGQALKSNVEILKKHSLLASVKMPTDLFMPQAGVQTSVYIFKAHEPHDYEKPVKFIDFRNDGFKRTKRGLNEASNPTKRYEEIIKIYKAGLNAKVSKELWGDLKTIYIEDFIAKPCENKHAKDFNFEAHQKNETKPELEDFKRTIADYLSYEVGLILKNQTPPK